jgi:hypothetical protein
METFCQPNKELAADGLTKQNSPLPIKRASLPTIHDLTTDDKPAQVRSWKMAK